MRGLIDETLKSGLAARRITPNFATVLPPEQQADHYDGLAGGYDLLVGNSLYNRLLWASWAADYRLAAAVALNKMGEGAILDCGCGSLVFTAGPYAAAPLDRLVLFDRSQGMLRRGMARLPTGQFLQGDATDMPFRDGAFSGVMCWGFLHVLGSASPLVAELRRVLAPGGTLVLSTLTLSDRAISNHWLGLLQRKGEAVAERRDVVLAAIEAHFDIASFHQKGAMLCVEAR
jgi:ubiquinone/menaquinone biosynthesis C-methylase UbiE